MIWYGTTRSWVRPRCPSSPARGSAARPGSWTRWSRRPRCRSSSRTSSPRRSRSRRPPRPAAAAVLLTATILPHRLMAVLIDACLARGVTPFVEITSGAELSALTRPEACVVAVNNTDIRTRESDEPDLGRSHDLLPRVRAASAGLAVSASGIATPEEAAGLLAAGLPRPADRHGAAACGGSGRLVRRPARTAARRRTGGRGRTAASCGGALRTDSGSRPYGTGSRRRQRAEHGSRRGLTPAVAAS